MGKEFFIRIIARDKSNAEDRCVFDIADFFQNIEIDDTITHCEKINKREQL